MSFETASVINETSGEVLYQNAFITNHVLQADHLPALVTAGRARWKIESQRTTR